MTQTTFTVPDMACAGCKVNIESALNDLSGVARSEADPQGKQIEVSYAEESVSPAQLAAAIQQAGYTVSG